MNGYGENHADVVPLSRTDIEGSKTPIIISINVSGTTFQVKASTLLRFPNSRLADLVLKHSACTGQSFYFDQDPAIFGHILRCCRSGEVHIPQTICPREFLKEIEFWKLPLDKVSPCCWPTFYRADDILETLEKLKEVTSEICDRPTNNHVRSFRNKVWLFLENPNYSKGAKVWFYIYQTVVALSIVVYFMWMVPSLRVEPYLQHVDYDHNHSNDKVIEMVETDPHLVLFLLDSLCIIVFLVEFLLRFTFCPHKRNYFSDWFNVLNAALLITTVTSFILEVRKDLIHTHAVGFFYYIVKSCYVFRLLLLLRLEKQYLGLKILILSVKESARELFLLVFSLLMAMCIFGGLMFCAEIHTTQFPDIWISLWWALITITTIGYGDIYPTDLPGRIIGSLCAVCGIMLLALPIAVIASKFSDFYGFRSYVMRHEKLCKKSESSSSNQVISTIYRE